MSHLTSGRIIRNHLKFRELTNDLTASESLVSTSLATLVAANDALDAAIVAEDLVAAAAALVTLRALETSMGG